MRPKKPFISETKVLLIEDDPRHVDILKDKFQEYRAAHLAKVFISGAEAIEYLENQALNEDSEESVPDIIMLDLGLPNESGMDVLKTLKAHPQLKDIPVIIYTASTDKHDIVESYRRGSVFFMNKEWNVEILNEAIQHVKTVRNKSDL